MLSYLLKNAYVTIFLYFDKNRLDCCTKKLFSVVLSSFLKYIFVKVFIPNLYLVSVHVLDNSSLWHTAMVKCQTCFSPS